MVFGSSVVFYLALLVTKDLLSLVFYSLAQSLVPHVFVGATSDELSAVVQWHTWSYRFGEVLSRVISE